MSDDEYYNDAENERGEEFEYDEEGGEEKEFEEVDYGELDADEGGDEKDDFEPMTGESYISMEKEWRDFDGDVSKSRVGMARAIDIDEDIRTDVVGTSDIANKFKRIEFINRSPNDIFRTLAYKVVLDYNLTKDDYEESLRVMGLINKFDKKLKYKSPKTIVLALLIFDSRNVINKHKLEQVYENKAKFEQISKVDLLRYAFFIQSLRQIDDS